MGRSKTIRVLKGIEWKASAVVDEKETQGVLRNISTHNSDFVTT